MSIRLMEQAWTVSPSGGHARLVLLALANNADDEAQLAWPSVSYVASRTKVSERTVQRCLRELVELGDVSVYREGGRSAEGYRATVYKVHPGQGCQSVGQVARGDKTDPSGVTPVSPQPSIEPSIESVSTTHPTVAPAREAGRTNLALDDERRPHRVVNRKVVGKAEWLMVDLIVQAFNEAFGTSFKPSEKTVVSRVVMRLRDYPAMGIEKHREVIRRAARSPWWEGKPTTIAVVYGQATFPRLVHSDEPREESTRDWVERFNANARSYFGGDDV